MYMKLLAVISLCLSAQMASAAAKAYYIHLKQSQRVDWVKEDKPGYYKIYIFEDGLPGAGKDTQPRIVEKSELSFASKSPINGVKLGSWALVKNEFSGLLDHCIVEDIFENGKTFLFCDVTRNGRQTRLNHVVDASELIAETSGQFEKGDTACLRAKFEDYAKGTEVTVKAMFTNDKSLILKDSLAAKAMGGPSFNALSKVVDTNLLIDCDSIQDSNSKD